MMSRIIDIKQLLPKIPICQKEIIIEVTEDKECPWNVGSWLVSQGNCKKYNKQVPSKLRFMGGVNYYWEN